MVETTLFHSQDVAACAQIICKGELLAIPTETVYGLGANGLDPVAVTKIFQAKGRPQDNPLILHIPTADWLERYCVDIPDVAWTLAEQFWPGPLTMILKRREIVPDVVTSGLDTVGMRCPDNDTTRAIIACADVPVAAPSANTSGRPSPTTADHVWADMAGRIAGIVDAGACAVGVESTILDVTVTPPRLLRPGGLALEALEAVAGNIVVDDAVLRQMAEGEKPRAPGMKYRHYAPKAPVTVVRGTGEDSARYIQQQVSATSGVICFDQWAERFPQQQVRTLGPEGESTVHAQRVFDALRHFDQTDVTEIWAQCPTEEGLGLAVANRLNKAAGFHIIDATAEKGAEKL